MHTSGSGGGPLSIHAMLYYIPRRQVKNIHDSPMLQEDRSQLKYPHIGMSKVFNNSVIPAPIKLIIVPK